MSAFPTRSDRERQMFPAAFWVTRFGNGMPIFKGSDEWGRHTICVGIPFLAHLVIPTKPCDCDDMTEFRCTFPGCPYMGCTEESLCQSHDRRFWLEEAATA